jgi:hypothetical protein
VPRHPRFYSLRNNRFQGLAGSASLSLVEIISNLILEFLSAPYIAAFAPKFAASLASNSGIFGTNSGISGKCPQFSDQFSDDPSADKVFSVAAA